MFRVLLCFMAALSLAACKAKQDQPAGDRAYPALWEISDSSGVIEGWLFGTIHALPDDTDWQSEQLDMIVEQADVLVVEVANLEDRAELSRLFERMAFDRPSAPIGDRIDPELQDEFDILLVKAGVQRSYFDPMESWAAALALAQVAQSGDARNGADRVLLDAFNRRPTIELEGAAAQLSIFDTLPEKEQRDLLNAVLVEASAYDEQSGEMANAWLAGDVEALSDIIQRGMLADPELRQALLIDRNVDWSAKIENLLSTDDRPLIAVGAGHLVGPDGLPARLEQSGYTVRRVN